MTRYFKLVAIRENKKDWMKNELTEGKARFGWGPPGSDLRQVEKIPGEKRTNEQKVIWRHAQFLLKRLKIGDRLIIQHEQPLRKFIIAEVTGPYGFTNTEDDFNHYVECKLLSKEDIHIESNFVSQSLRHHLSKRGRYYEIYNEAAVHELDHIVEQLSEGNSQIYHVDENTEKMENDLEKFEGLILGDIRNRMVDNWPSFVFEKFVADLIEQTPGVEVKMHKDNGQGWDIVMRILDPADPTGETILHDDVPVQCKSYKGVVNDTRAIDDLRRCTENSDSPIAYLFILGNLTADFINEYEKGLQKVRNDYGKGIDWRIVDEEQIAKMYLNRINYLNI